MRAAATQPGRRASGASDDEANPATRHAATALPPHHAPLLVDDDGAAALLGISRRTFTDLIPQPWMPAPIQLGVRLRRWSVVELSAAIAQMPRQGGDRQQPQALLRARIERAKATGDLR